MDSKEPARDIILPGNYLHTSLYLSKTNLGFAGGNNWGMTFAKGDYVLIINNDTEVTPDLIEMLLIPFQIDTRTGVACPKINYFTDKRKIQYAGFSRMNHATGRTKTIGNREIDQGQFDELKLTWGAHGAAMMVKKEVIEKVGKFHEKFFLYYEEWDWATRILRAGYKIFFQGLATVYHKESMSVGKLNPMKEYYLTRNRILYMRRNSHGLRLVAFTAFFTLFTIPKTTLEYLVKGNFAFLNAFLRGIRDNLKMLSCSPV
jgi:GT2 family glycosyltransferase